MNKVLHFLVSKLFWGILIHFVNDYWYAKIRYWLVMDKWGDFHDPVLFTEKIQYIKLYERTKLRKMVADRLKVRNYVLTKVGEEHLIPLLGNYDTLKQKDWNILPDQFVLKANHGCGMVKIITDKTQQSYEHIIALTEKWKNIDYYQIGHEWVYKGLSREIIAETLITDSNNRIPKDWKFFCFHGEVKVIQEDVGRYESEPHTRNLYDRNFNKIEAKLLYPPYSGKTQKPELWDLAIEVAESLSSDFNFIRVDLYITQSNVYFGELTNYPGNGFIPFEPRSMEYKIGNLLDLKKHAVSQSNA
ncbi:ATP-grasp fold amidoligase family protein [Gracilimonas sp. Q87]|uniref:ATP-grasp fold amidoligase family protein n=1 Tax=Gracilimonas sp. Q87 TaxID=3384766 RepID=UPI0039844BA4